MKILPYVVVRITLLVARTPAESPATGPNFIPAISSEIVIEGRYAPSPAGGIRLGFSGTVLHLRYHGSQLTLRAQAATDEVFFDVGVDGAEPVRLRLLPGQADYQLIHQTNTADHLLEITRRTESWQGACEIIGFSLGPAGQLLPPPPLPTRKLMFIGDSITCGVMTDLRPHDPLTGLTAHAAETSNARLSYAKILARQLNAQCVLVSYGGRGVIRDWQGIRKINNAPQFYELALPDDPASLWPQDNYEPDAIAICLGTNDFNQGVPDENEFVNGYVEFLRKIRRDSPRARLFLLDSPILNDPPGQVPKHTILHTYLQEIVNLMNTPQVQIATVSHYPGVPNNGHPTRAEHELIAQELAPQFRQALNW